MFSNAGQQIWEPNTSVRRSAPSATVIQGHLLHSRSQLMTIKSLGGWPKLTAEVLLTDGIITTAENANGLHQLISPRSRRSAASQEGLAALLVAYRLAPRPRWGWRPARRVPLDHRPDPDRRSSPRTGSRLRHRDQRLGRRILALAVPQRLSGFWSDISQPAALSAIWLSLWLSLSVAAINAVMGIAIAWVLVRDEFPGKRVVEGLIDLPFALPTIVAGVVLLFLYGQASPIKVDLFETWMGLMVALLFVTLPFSVRAVQPVLESLDGQAESAARSLGAGRLRTFLTVVLPSLLPAVLAGFGLAFARAIGEFGSISLIAGGIARTTTASSYIYNLTQGFLWPDAAAVSTALLV